MKPIVVVETYTTKFCHTKDLGKLYIYLKNV